MGFNWDEYESGGSYISAAEKKALAEGGIPFTIKAIRQVHKFEHENYELTIDVPDASGAVEERVLSFPIGSGAESRDNLLHGLKGHIAESGETVEAKVTKVGRAYFIAKA